MIKPIYNNILFLVFFFVGFTVFGQQTYLDEFSSVQYDNTDGTLNWSGNSWVETGDDNSPSSGYIRITGNELRFNWIYTNSENIRRTADLSGATSATLSFDWQSIGLWFVFYSTVSRSGFTKRWKFIYNIRLYRRYFIWCL